jgi:hypothetical protein
VIASRRSSVALVAAFGAALAACSTPAGEPKEAPLAPLEARVAYLPDTSDRAARDLAQAALGTDATAARAQLAAFETIERLRVATGEPPTGLIAYARHLVDSMNDDPIAYRRATAQLLEDDDIDPALRKQLEMEVADDPLLLADKRISEGRRTRIARDVNALSEALGRSLLSFVFLPVRVAQAVINVAVAEHLDDPISVQQRQALEHWKQYVEAHPETPEAHELLERIESLQKRWFDTKRRRSARAAEQALDHDQSALALLLADRALRYAPGDARATHLRDEAKRRLAHDHAQLADSLDAASGPLPDADDPRARELLLALFDAGDVATESEALLAADPTGPLADGARFTHANAIGEAGQESAMWDALAELAGDDPASHPMARHARALVESPAQNPWEAFKAAEGRDTRKAASFVALGPLQGGARDRDLPRSVEWLLEAPTLMPVLGGIPWRLVQTAIAPPEAKAPALAASRYLERYPNGEHAAELRDYLVEHESDEGRWVRAHATASEISSTPSDELAELAEKAAAQSIEQAGKQNRRDIRLAILQATAERYPGTESGRRANELLRKEIEEATEQKIRISRGYLIENRNVAGSGGLGLRPELLDDDKHNGELHPLGVTLLGGRELEIAMLAPSGDEDDEPKTVRQTVSAERLSRVVSLLEETSTRNALLDPLAEQGADARRDFFFERARLGVADAPDARPTAESTYAFVGMREKYNMVRSRESILPVEIVISGSLPDLGLGAFPRLRTPKQTPDAVLFK